MDIAVYNKERKALTSALKKILAPHLWESGYRDGPIGGADRKPIPIWIQKGKGKDAAPKTFVLKGGFVIREFEGFTDQAVITEAGYGMLTAYYDQLPIEDLFRLKNWAERKFANIVPPKKVKSK